MIRGGKESFLFKTVCVVCVLLKYFLVYFISFKLLLFLQLVEIYI